MHREIKKKKNPYGLALLRYLFYCRGLEPRLQHPRCMPVVLLGNSSACCTRTTHLYPLASRS